jgi:hypothetical protein
MEFVSSRNFRDFTLLAVGFLAQNFPSARSASVTNNVCKDADIFNKQMIKLKHPVTYAMELYCTPKVNTLQLNTVDNFSRILTHVHVRPARSRNTNSYRIPTGPLVTIFHHSLPFLQSGSVQKHVGTICRRAIGPLAHHNGTSAYSPSLTRHLPAPTIGCLHRPPYKLAGQLKSLTSRIHSKVSVYIIALLQQIHCYVCFHCYAIGLLR